MNRTSGCLAYKEKENTGRNGRSGHGRELPPTTLPPLLPPLRTSPRKARRPRNHAARPERRRTRTRQGSSTSTARSGSFAAAAFSHREIGGVRVRRGVDARS